MAVGPTQVLIIVLVLLLLFGAARLPQLGKSIGAGIKNFKKGLLEGDEDEEEEKKKADGEKRD